MLFLFKIIFNQFSAMGALARMGTWRDGVASQHISYFYLYDFIRSHHQSGSVRFISLFRSYPNISLIREIDKIFIFSLRNILKKSQIYGNGYIKHI